MENNNSAFLFFYNIFNFNDIHRKCKKKKKKKKKKKR